MSALESPAPGAQSELARIFSRQKEAFAAEPYPPREARARRLDRLADVLEKNEERLAQTIAADFGARSRFETIAADIIVSLAAIRRARRGLPAWMRSRPVPTPLQMLPGTSFIASQPLGVVGIIAPWNYPVQLAVAPAAGALAAGNRVMIKPSEMTPRTSEALREMVAGAFDERELAVVVGGPEIGEAFASLPFDHLLFTGSTEIGRKIYMAAAKNLTPVTLELGGKSPAIIDESANLAAAAASIAHAKTFNAGQTCVAPDYVLVPEQMREAAVDAIASAARRLYPDIDTTDDYTSIVSDRHFARLKALVADAKDRGANIIEIGSANALYPRRKLPLTIIVDPPADSRLMKEEIFGPVLPVIGVAGADEALAHVARGERPLALYWFGADARACDRMLRDTLAGGVTINDALWHVAQENLPFGGVGESGIGAYHGEAGFERFSHMKPVFRQSRFGFGKALYPPFGKKTERLLNLARKIV